LTAIEDEELIRGISAAAPDFLFVALGAPRQDLWIFEHRARMQVPVAIGVGCVLDLYAGEVNRAPTWMQRSGLEWGFRLAQEPGRLWRRYILDDVPMLGRLVLTTMGGRAQGLALGRAAPGGL
jgi:N-acetylglucosaminyldiphosphoundecaprenol N-acetyl-beta-D-mannosaminyltransferase